MKSFYLFTIVVLYSAMGFSQVTPIADTNFEQLLVDQGIDSNGLNGTILDSDAQLVTTLDLGDNGIIDITGISAFTSLTSLDLGNNQVANVNLNDVLQLVNFRSENNDALTNIDFSQNLLLETIYIDSNVSVAGESPITVLDFSQNTNLISIELRWLRNVADFILPLTNTLTEVNIRYLADATLDFSLLDNLQNLQIRGSEVSPVITLPNVSTNLLYLNITSINIPTIDISNYSNLESIYFWGTYVQNLILPNSSTLTDIFILLHDIQNTLDLSVLPNLEDVRITSNQTTPLLIDVTQNYELLDLNLSNNDIITIDVTQNLLLEGLNLSTNNLATLDVSQNGALTSLNCAYNQLPTIDLSQNLLLETLNLNTNVLPFLDVTQNIELRSVIISNNLFTGTGLDLTQNSELRYLNISYNQVESLNISGCVNLVNIIASHNLFSGTDLLDQLYVIKSSSSGVSASNIIDVSFNDLSGAIPDFAGLVGTNANYFRFYFHNNAFEFGHFEEQHTQFVNFLTQTNTFGSSELPIMTAYWYAPQAKVDTIDIINANAGDSVTLTTICAGTQNHYLWFKDGVLIPNAPDASSYTIPSANSCDQAVYHSEITSDLVPFDNTDAPGTNGKNLLLVRNDITLNITSPPETCVALSSPVIGSTNVSLNQTLEWTENLGACGYFLSIGTTPGGTDILNNVDVGDVNDYNTGTNFPPNTQIYITVTPYFYSGTSLTCPEVSFTTGTTESPTSCTSLIQPLNGAIDVPTGTMIEWAGSPFSTGYYLTLGTTSGGTDILNAMDVGNTTNYSLSAPLPESTVVYAVITPYNGLGNATGCIEETFTTEGTIISCTTLSSPLNGDIDVALSTDISWNSVTDATGYMLTIGTTAGGSDILNALDVNNVTIYNLPTDLPDNTIIYVTVTPYNLAGNAIGCIEQSFTTERIPPACTTLVLPLNNAVDIALDTNISWNSVTDATGYMLTIGTTLGGIDILNAVDVNNVTVYNLPSDLPENTVIYVTVTPYNSAGNAIGCSEESFTTVLPYATCSNLISPQFQEIDVPVDTNLTWSVSDYADGYRLAIGTATGLGDIMPLTDLGNVTTYNIPFTLPSNTTVFVTIISYNANGNTVCGDDQFTTENLVPVCVNLLSPYNGEINVGIQTNLSWETDVNADGYILSVGTTAGGNNLVNGVDVGGITSYNLTSNLPQNTTIFVSITSYNTLGQAVGCATDSFTTQLLIPQCTAIQTPYNLEADVSVNTDLNWNATPYAEGYIVTVSTSSGGIDIVNNEDIGNITTYSFTDELPVDTTIFVTIIAYNATGTALNCSETRFVTEIKVPDCTYLITPTNNETDVLVTAMLNWNAITNASGYIISLGTTINGTDILNAVDLGNITSYTPVQLFPDGTVIYVSITPYNTTGNAINCVSESFTTKEINIITPRFFTPNNDTFNDLWKVKDPKNEIRRIYIYDRYGKLMISYANSNYGWDGTFNGKALPTSDYWYGIELKTGVILKGHFTLKR